MKAKFEGQSLNVTARFLKDENIKIRSFFWGGADLQRAEADVKVGEVIIDVAIDLGNGGYAKGYGCGTRKAVVQFKGLGYRWGEDEAIEDAAAKGIKLPFVLIREDDAAEAGAEDCYFAALTDDEDAAVTSYEASGGTASYIRLVAGQGAA